MTHKYTDEHWEEVAETLRRSRRNIVHLDDVGKATKRTGRQVIINALHNLIRIGAVRAEQRGKRKEYYLNE